MKNKKNKIRRSFSIDPNVYEDLKKEAENEDLPVSTTLNRILRKVFKLRKK